MLSLEVTNHTDSYNTIIKRKAGLGRLFTL